jgi:hypothetical protein
MRAIVSAYSVYPEPTAEAVVNAALLDSLGCHVKLGLVTSRYGYQSLTRPARREHDRPLIRACSGTWGSDTVVERAARWLRHPKSHPAGLLARLVDRARTEWIGLPSLTTAAWSAQASNTILAWLDAEFRDAVVWARANPPYSFEAVISAFKTKPFPLVANYNDPIPYCLLRGVLVDRLTPVYNRFQHRQNRYIAKNAQAWTFPSRRLAETMCSVAGFDAERCFVIPHVAPEAAEPPAFGAPDSMTGVSEPWLLYAGTYYPTAFSDITKAGIAKYTESGGRLKLMFALKRPPSEAVTWIGKDVRGSRVIQDLSPLEVAGLTRRARAVLICDAPEHSALLLTKVTHALHSNKPILALTSAQSTTGEVVRAAGGVVADSSSVEKITEGFRRLDQLLDDKAQLCESIKKQQQVRARFSAERVSSDSIAVLAYTASRYAWSLDKNQPEPEPPKIEKWP